MSCISRLRFLQQKRLIPEEGNDRICDAIVIGGGVNGTGLVRDLARRGFRAVLFEKGDFARGATGNSSGMIHGGARYLLNDTGTTKNAHVSTVAMFKTLPSTFSSEFRSWSLSYARTALARSVHFSTTSTLNATTATRQSGGFRTLGSRSTRRWRSSSGLEGDFLGGVPTSMSSAPRYRVVSRQMHWMQKPRRQRPSTCLRFQGFPDDRYARGDISGVEVVHARRWPITIPCTKTVIQLLCRRLWARTHSLVRWAVGSQAIRRAKRSPSGPLDRRSHPFLGRYRSSRWPSGLHRPT